MTVTVKGIKVDNVSIKVDENGVETFEGNYSLISSIDKVLAKQSFNGYNDIKIEASVSTKKALAEIVGCIKTDIEIALGLSEQKGE